MPIYEYQCTACGKVAEYIQKMTDPPKTTCEACSGALEKLISRSAFHLKGGGWYKDLYASAKPGEAKKSDSGSSDSASTASSSSTSTASSSSSSSDSSSSSGSSTTSSSSKAKD